MQIHGHRGAAEVFPHNSLGGILYALNEGADSVEVDLHLTQDDILVLQHDPTCPNPQGQPSAPGGSLNPWIYQMKFAEVAGWPLPAANSRRGHHLPTHPLASGLCSLQQVVEVLQQRFAFWQRERRWLNLELKYDSTLAGQAYPSRQHLTTQLAHTLHRLKLTHRVLIQSFDWPLLRWVRRELPDIPIAPLYNGELWLNLKPLTTTNLRRPDWHKVANFCREIRAVGFSAHYRLLEFYPQWRNLAEVQSQAWEVLAWTVNRKVDYLWLQNLGVSTLITDRPDYFVGLQKGRSLNPANKDFFI